MINEHSRSPSPAGRWLIADDDENVLEFLAFALRQIGVEEIVAVSNAGTALMLFTTEPNAFQAVITDLNMPLMNGDELCRHLHAITPGLKVFLVTGNGLMTEQMAGRDGFAGLLRKPFSIAELRALFSDVTNGGTTGDSTENMAESPLNIFFQKSASFTIA